MKEYEGKLEMFDDVLGRGLEGKTIYIADIYTSRWGSSSLGSNKVLCRGIILQQG